MKKERIIRIVACLAFATGLFQIFRQGLPPYLYVLKNYSQLEAAVGTLITVLGIVIMIVPILKLTAAIGLFMFKRWGWISLILVLLLDFAFGLNGATRYCVSSFHPQAPPVLSDPNSVTTVISLYPMFIRSFIAIFSVLILVQKPIRKHFEPAPSEGD